MKAGRNDGVHKKKLHDKALLYCGCCYALKIYKEGLFFFRDSFTLLKFEYNDNKNTVLMNDSLSPHWFMTSFLLESSENFIISLSYNDNII